ncbi:hypothetical protein [Usitatibacter palustris]|uniref:hypothetical protein n=1 Tax=Usitatibacter palustris TaxID=2732487 RepID=UPI001487FACC|nr:hypothetical protein [Usitatibacter palustris]
MKGSAGESAGSEDEELLLERLIAEAMAERVPQFEKYLVPPFEVAYHYRGAPMEVWVVARAKSAVLFIELESEQFGVGFLLDGGEVENVNLFPSAELAAPAFQGAIAHDI